MHPNHRAASLFIVLSLWAIALAGCTPSESTVSLPYPTYTPSAVPATVSPFNAYFTTPETNLSVENMQGVEQYLVAAIDAAQRSVDIAIYNFTLKSISDAAIHAHQRGVAVRIVMESDNMDSNSYQRMKDAGIEVVGDDQKGSMHNKFVVIDGYQVWTGSTNLSAGAFYNDNNNLLSINSTQVAQNYTVEFEEMFYDHLFGPEIKYATPNPIVTVSGRTIETYFSPDDGVAVRLVQLIQNADARVDFLAFSLTSDPIAQALIACQRAGIMVRGVMDESQVTSNTGGEYDVLKDAGVDVRLDGNQNLMHHKVMIIDGRYVATGSYNFSGNAERTNDENLVIIDDPALAAQYEAEFEKLYAIGN